MLKKISLTPKILLITTFAALTVWFFLDRQQSKSIRAIFLHQFDQALGAEAELNRRQFDRYLLLHVQTLRIIGLQEQLQNHLDAKAKDQQLTLSPSAEQQKEPPWFPPRSVLRSLIVIRHALLFDEAGQLREAYRSPGDQPLPAQLRQPSALIRQESLNQLYMTTIDELPYVLSSIEIPGKNAPRRATIMLVSPLDDQFLQDSQGEARQNKVVALIDMDKLRVLASDHPEIMPSGTPLSTIEQHYKILGKSFFDYGASSLQTQFSSMLKLEEYEELSREFLAQERRYRFILAAVLLMVFIAISCWITRQIKALTGAIAGSAQEAEIKVNRPKRGDELLVLQESFEIFSKEILQSRRQLLTEKSKLERTQEQLAEKNQEINTNRQKLQAALDNISALIRQTTVDGSFQVRFENAHLQKCYEIINCQEEGCPCYGQEARRCWLESPRCCKNQPAKPIMRGKQGDCFACPVFKAATRDPIVFIGEQFNSMMHILEQKNIELHGAYQELKTAQSQLLQKEKMASVGQLAAGIAHEINNPLAFVSSNIITLGKYLAKLGDFMQVVEKEFLASGDDQSRQSYAQRRETHKLDHLFQDGRELIEESREGIARIKKIIDTLQGFAGMDQTEKRPVDLNDCLTLALEMINPELSQQITIRTDFATLPAVACSPHKLSQAFFNIILNALKAISAQGEITIRTSSDQTNVYVSIADTGVGIAAADLGRIFEPFYTTRAVGQGTGLGLSMSYDIITEHGGSIAAESVIGQGSTFRIILPVSSEGPGREDRP